MDLRLVNLQAQRGNLSIDALAELADVPSVRIMRAEAGAVLCVEDATAIATALGVDLVNDLGATDYVGG